jgi:hypothetical protein
MLRFMFMLKANCNRNILGKVSYLIFKANFHGFSSIYSFKVNVT